MSYHARLSPSSAHRWMKCPGSVNLCKDIPSAPSRAAAEGTAAHTLAARWLKEGGKPTAWCESIDGIAITNEMCDAIQLYCDEARDASAGMEPAVEMPVNLSWIPGLEGGTVDACSSNSQHLLDFKYGAGVRVKVQGNPQLMLYALGVYGFGRAVRTTVVQPRCPHPDGPVRTIEYSAMELFDFAVEAAEAAGRTEAPDAPLVTGDHCRFCPARMTCPALRAKVLAGIEEVGERLADLLAKARLVKPMIAMIERGAYAEALAGRVLPGFKLVPSRGRRVWDASADDVLAAVSEFGLTTDDIYETTLISPAAMDKLLRRDKKAIVPFVAKIPGAPALVDESDPRPAVASIEASEVFQIEQGEDESDPRPAVASIEASELFQIEQGENDDGQDQE